MVRQLTERHTLTIPQEALKRVGAKSGDFFDVTTAGIRIILTPRTFEESFTDKEWKTLRRLAKSPGTPPMSSQAAKRYLRRLLR